MWALPQLSFLSTRKQIFILKLLVPTSIFVIIVMMFWSRMDTSGIVLYEVRKPLNASTLIRMRRIAMNENQDEFLDIVLKELKFSVVNLRKRTVNKREYNDEVILADEKKVVPELGNKGVKATVPKKYEAKANASMKRRGFNIVLNSLVSVTRSVPDPREPGCKNIYYNLDNLPTLSIITIFNNEPYISIIRMLHGIINRTPPHLLVEIILVDDFSSNRDLFEKLERYLATKLPVEKLQLVRLHKRAGLIRARMIGAKLAIGDVLVFLDAHCEVAEYWAEPLLQRIKQDKTVLACPVVDIIDEKTLEYQYAKDYNFLVGGFKWTGDFEWIPVPERERKRKHFSYEPTKSPTMPGIFAIDRTYFWKMGSYDPGMKIWGGENLEMSFRIWQCGGSIEVIPCSRVGQLFRSYRPYPFTADAKTNNFARVAEVWMDDYKELLLKHQVSEPTKMGNVTLRKDFRIRNKCQSFQWYLNNVYPEKFRMERESKYYGQVLNPESHFCLDYWGPKMEKYALSLYNCSSKFYISQEYFLSKAGQLRQEKVCATAKNDSSSSTVRMVLCDEQSYNANFRWRYNPKTMQLSNRATTKCLAVVNGETTKGINKNVKYGVIVQMCNTRAGNQKWEFRPGHPEPATLKPTRKKAKV